MTVQLFPFTEYWWFYLAFTAFVFFLLALDLGVFHRQAHAVSIREAAIWSVVWISLALLFNYGLYQYALWQFPQDPRLTAVVGFDPQAAARETALEFLAGFVVEKSLSVDNIFVFIVIFTYFAVPAEYQHRILFFGILGALLFRSIFIALGSVLLQFHWVIYLFGAFLVFTGVKLLFSSEKPVKPDKNPVVRLVRRLVPVSPHLHGQKFFVRQDGVLQATPLFLALTVVEFTDIIFAVDSVPAIYALTDEPLIVFTSNVFAILGLRALYFVLAGMMDKFYLLKYGLAVVLIFVGVKMVLLNELFGGKFPITWSLSIIAGILALSVAASLVFPRRHAGAAAGSASVDKHLH
jgi:tellurite resistance protein TerC